MNPRPEFEAYLNTVLQEGCGDKVSQAMAYATAAGGKRIRPALLFAAMEAYGKDPVEAFPAAAALEMIHTYSLIHDDLPAMDDDAMRRGRPSTHVAYGEAAAILAGDGLLTKAFELLVRQKDPSVIPALVSLYAQKAGHQGMIYGQILDLEGEGKDLSFADLQDIDRYKTGCLLQLPLLAAAVLAGHPEDAFLLEEAGEKLGIAFQIQDDILDVTSTPEIMGKSLSDQEREKATFVKLLGLDGAGKQAESLFADIQDLTEKTHMCNTSPLLELYAQILKRSH